MQSHFGTPRAAIMAVFAVFGAIFGTFAGSVPQLIAHFGLNSASYGLGVTVMSAATVAAMGVSGRIARHVSHRRLLLALMPALLVVLLLLFTATWLPLFFIFAALLGAVSGVLDVPQIGCQADATNRRLAFRPISATCRLLSVHGDLLPSRGV